MKWDGNRNEEEKKKLRELYKNCMLNIFVCWTCGAEYAIQLAHRYTRALSAYVVSIPMHEVPNPSNLII